MASVSNLCQVAADTIEAECRDRLSNGNTAGGLTIAVGLAQVEATLLLAKQVAKVADALSWIDSTLTASDPRNELRDGFDTLVRAIADRS